MTSIIRLPPICHRKSQIRTSCEVKWEPKGGEGRGEVKIFSVFFFSLLAPHTWPDHCLLGQTVPGIQVAERQWHHHEEQAALPEFSEYALEVRTGSYKVLSINEKGPYLFFTNTASAGCPSLCTLRTQPPYARRRAGRRTLDHKGGEQERPRPAQARSAPRWLPAEPHGAADAEPRGLPRPPCRRAGAGLAAATPRRLPSWGPAPLGRAGAAAGCRH